MTPTCRSPRITRTRQEARETATRLIVTRNPRFAIRAARRRPRSADVGVMHHTRQPHDGREPPVATTAISERVGNNRRGAPENLRQSARRRDSRVDDDPAPRGNIPTPRETCPPPHQAVPARRRIGSDTRFALWLATLYKSSNVLVHVGRGECTHAPGPDAAAAGYTAYYYHSTTLGRRTRVPGNSGDTRPADRGFECYGTYLQRNRMTTADEEEIGRLSTLSAYNESMCTRARTEYNGDGGGSGK